MTTNDRIRLYLPILAALYEVDSVELTPNSLRHIITYLLKTSSAKAQEFLDTIATISEEDPEGKAIAWFEQYLTNEEPGRGKPQTLIDKCNMVYEALQKDGKYDFDHHRVVMDIDLADEDSKYNLYKKEQIDDHDPEPILSSNNLFLIIEHINIHD